MEPSPMQAHLPPTQDVHIKTEERARVRRIKKKKKTLKGKLSHIDFSPFHLNKYRYTHSVFNGTKTSCVLSFSLSLVSHTLYIP
jgi:hypothetical protein